MTEPTTPNETQTPPTNEQKQKMLDLQTRMVELRFKQTEAETANGIMFCAMAIAKGIILELLNQFLDDDAISKEDYHRYRDSILELMKPLKTQAFIEEYYLEMERDVEIQKQEMRHGIPDDEENEEVDKESSDITTDKEETV